MKKSHHGLTNSRISKREFDISIIRKTKRMLGKRAFLGVLGVFVNERHQDVGSDAVLVLFNGCLVLFNGWGGLRSNGFLMAVARQPNFQTRQQILPRFTCATLVSECRCVASF